MDKLIGTIVDIDGDKDDIWFSLRVKMSSSFRPTQEVDFDCRIDCRGFDYKNIIDKMLLAKDNLKTELEGFMMIDNPDDNEMQIWFSVFKMTIRDIVIYDTPAPNC
jgi:hypothetical protein